MMQQHRAVNIKRNIIMKPHNDTDCIYEQSVHHVLSRTDGNFAGMYWFVLHILDYQGLRKQ